MRKRIVVVVLAVLLAVSAHAQTTDFNKLVSTGTPQSIQDAINQGADVNAKDNQGMTPLLWAAGNNPNPDVITTLLKAGADPKARAGNSMTALILAAAGNKNPDVITTLLKTGADINAPGMNGMTALMWAASNNPNPDVITKLLKEGADPKARSKEGKTASDYALESGLLTGTDALRQLSETQPPGTKLVSTDGHFALYVPNERVPLTAAQVASNKNLFVLMESQVMNRPVMVSFDLTASKGMQASDSRAYDFIKWMEAVYGDNLALQNWGRGSGDVPFLERTEDNDFVIDIRPTLLRDRNLGDDLRVLHGDTLSSMVGL